MKEVWSHCNGVVRKFRYYKRDSSYSIHPTLIACQIAQSEFFITNGTFKQKMKHRAKLKDWQDRYPELFL